MGYNGAMKVLRWLMLVFVYILFVSDVQAESGVGAFLTPVSQNRSIQLTLYVPCYASVTILDPQGQVYASFIDKGPGKIITALPVPDINTGIFAAFYSDSIGLSSRISVDFSQGDLESIMPPTIYSRKLVKALGFIGTAYPGSSIELQIDSYTNEKTSYFSLADNTGEWQILAIDLPPGKYQAKAKASFQGKDSDWSQIMYVDILTPFDQAIEDFGKQTRSSVEQTIESLPGPLQQVAKTIDSRSEILSKCLFPGLLTLTTAAQSGLVIQNIFYLLYQAIIWLLQILGVSKKRVEAGIVYDAVTKRPISRAIVRLYDAATHRLIETDVTSSEGSFSFLPPEGYYYLRASKPGYIYPSRLIIGNRDGRFTQVYAGGNLEITAAKPVVSVALPLDPEAFSETLKMRLTNLWQRWFDPVNRWLLTFGFFMAILSYSRDPNKTNVLILVMYFFAWMYHFLQGKTLLRDYGTVVGDKGKPVAGIELNLIDVEFNRLVSRRVTDAKGRYQFLVPPGKYQIKLVTPGFSLVKSIKKSYQGDDLVISGEKGQSKRITPRIMVKAA